MLTILLSLGTSLSYGVANFLAPQLAKRSTLVTMVVVSQLAALLCCVLYLLADGGPVLGVGPTLVALLAGVGNAGGLIGFYKAAELGPLSVIAPVQAGTSTMIPVFWGLAHGDHLKALHAIGLVAIVVGCVLAARRTGPQAVELQPGAIAWALGSAVFFGTFLIAIPEASAHGRAWTLVDARLMLMICVAVWAGAGALRQIRLDRGAPLLTIPGVLLVAGTLFYAAAADRGQLSLVAVLSSLVPVVIVGLGVVVLHERLSRGQTAGVVAAMAGVVLVAT